MAFVFSIYDFCVSAGLSEEPARIPFAISCHDGGTTEVFLRSCMGGVYFVGSKMHTLRLWVSITIVFFVSVVGL